MKIPIYSVIIILPIIFYLLINQKNVTSTDTNLVNYDFSVDWIEDFALAQEMSITEEKPILIYFTGSNWCSGCIRLNKDIFSDPSFADFAEGQLILMKVDFPLGAQQDNNLIEQNNYLYDLYEIEGLPTVILTDSEGIRFRESGYGKESPEAYIENLKNYISYKN